MTDEHDNTPSKRPYMLRAIWQWCMDAGFTPQILVQAGYPGVQVPTEYVKDGAIVLNIHDRAVRELAMDNDAVSFSARFGGQPRRLYVPTEAIVAVYARENGQGLFFEVPGPEEAVPGGDEPAGEGEAGTDDAPDTPSRGRPNLRLV